MQLISDTTAIAAWKSAAQALVCAQGREVFNLLVQISEPCTIDSSWFERHSPHRCDPTGDKLSSVVNTVFPIHLAARSNSRQDLYRRYSQIYSRTKNTRRGTWGTYFHRLIGFPPSCNQLEVVIQKLILWEKKPKAALVFHLSSPTVDAPRTRGGPCWHFGEITCTDDGKINLVAVYRNHDYFNKALGNFISLGQLLKFIASESGKRPGTLVCHSVHAYFDGSADRMRRFASL